MNIIAAPMKIPNSANTGIGSLEKSISPVTIFWTGPARKNDRSIAPIDNVNGIK